MGKSVSIIIPAYNEEKQLPPAVDLVFEGLARNDIRDFEILIFNDASTDRTGEVANELAKKYSQIRVIHNSRNMNLGFNAVSGFQLATKEFVGVVHGDNETAPETLDNIFQVLGAVDTIITYTQNPEIRPRIRQFLSATYVTIINTAFGLNMRYYNGICFFKTALIKRVPVSTYGFAYITEILVKLLKSGVNFIEVPQVLKAREQASVKAFRLKNIVSVFKTFLILFWKVQILRERIDLQ